MTPIEAEEIIRRATGEIPPAKGRPSPSNTEIGNAVKVLGETTLHESTDTKDDREAIRGKLANEGAKLEKSDIGKLKRIADASAARRHQMERASRERAELEGPTGPGNPNATNRGRRGGSP